MFGEMGRERRGSCMFGEMGEGRAEVVWEWCKKCTSFVERRER